LDLLPFRVHLLKGSTCAHFEIEAWRQIILALSLTICFAGIHQANNTEENNKDHGHSKAYNKSQQSFGLQDRQVAGSSVISLAQKYLDA
jgi:hypothetical protein